MVVFGTCQNIRKPSVGFTLAFALGTFIILVSNNINFQIVKRKPQDVLLSRAIEYQRESVRGLEEQSKEYATRELVNLERRARVDEVCRSLPKQFRAQLLRKYGPFNQASPYEIDRKYFIYAPWLGMAYCQIPKVASTTWTRNFMILSGLKAKEKNHLIAPKLMSLPKDQDPQEAMRNVTSLIIVRNPLSRLVSTYYSKFIEMGLKKWNPVRTLIITTFRKNVTDQELVPLKGQIISEDDPVYPTPDEYLKFVLSNLGVAKEPRIQRTFPVIDRHWERQFKLCPICLFNFSIYSKMEELEDDFEYILEKSDLRQRVPKRVGTLETKNHLNMKTTKMKQVKFWKRVSNETLRQTIRAYKVDFMLFDYDPAEYFNNLGLTALNMS